MDFHDNPKRSLDELAEAWELQTKDSEAQIGHALSTIVSWRWATDDMFSSHPLFGLADTTPDAEPWRPFTQTWLVDGEKKATLKNCWKHGFDHQGRIVLAQSQWYALVTAWRDDGCDRLQIYESPDAKGVFRWGSRYDDNLWFTRYWYNGDGQIECRCTQKSERGTIYRKFEWFEYDGERCVESIQQCFETMSELPHWEREKSDIELRKRYRPLTGNKLVNNVVEAMIWRRRVQYNYASPSVLLSAEEFDADHKPVEELRYEKLPERSLKETVADLADKVTAAIRKTVEDPSPTKPYRALALIYSAEHAHCGLPHHVRVLDYDSPWPSDRQNVELYPTELNVAFHRPVFQLWTEFNQRVRDLFPDDDDGDVKAAVSAMRQIATQLYQHLSNSEHVTEDFAVVAIDDHGDVNAFSVPGRNLWLTLKSFLS